MKQLTLLAVTAIAAALPYHRSTAQEVAGPILEKPASELVAILNDKDAKPFDKAKACQRLAIVGDKNAIPALVAQLPDEQLNVYARTALEAIPGAEGAAALRDAAGKLAGRPLVGVLDSLGQMRDAASVDLLKQKLADSDAAVRAAAAVALGTIGDEASAAALQAAVAAGDAKTPGFGEACIKCADALAHSGPPAAVALYDQLLASAAPEHVRLAAALGRIQASGDDPAVWLRTQLQSQDKQEFDLGLAAARKLGGAPVTQALVELLPALEPERRALLLRAIGDRRDQPTLEALVIEARSDAPAVRAAAVDVIAQSGSPEAAGELLNVAFGGSDAAPVALDWLKSVRSDVIDRAIAERAGGAEKPTAALVELIGSRRISALAPNVAKLLADENAAVRQAALASLGQIATLAELEALVTRALAAGDVAEVQAARDALRTAALRLSERDAAAERLAAELAKSTPENQAYLLALLREMGAGSAKALAAVVEASGSTNAALKEAATQELGAWPTADAAPALLGLAKSDPDNKYRIRALRGYLRIARQLQLSGEDRLHYFKEGFALAQRDEERQLALDVLSRVRTPESLELATSYLDQPALAAAAADSAVRIAQRLIDSNQPAVAAGMTKVVATADLPQETATRARELLERAGGGQKP